jgi:hypothetical protein
MPPRVTLDESIQLVCSGVTSLQTNQQYTIDVARDKLLFVEYNIERRYLKPPFGPGSVKHLELTCTYCIYLVNIFDSSVVIYSTLFYICISSVG